MDQTLQLFYLLLTPIMGYNNMVIIIKHGLRRGIILYVFICSLTGISLAQDKKLIQLTGKVTDELLQPLSFAHILVLNNYRGAITNIYGNFSLVVEEADSVLISSVGYKRKYMVIPDNLPTHFMNIELVLQIDTLVIGEAQIYPWKTYEEFKEAFVNLKLPTDDMERARKEHSPDKDPDHHGS